ncbi:collagen alpha-5(IV) chain-like [Strongylocentrotus purpuratus]|uniref:Arrestin C-terminal-like domain-containing protein n=1 Tax=Strongylocentrotus purpuratus TaxID=7668 RepID=A0A7M7N8C1_STRPU|nr:collagen alpha-5(IV) chain-like [Strongylocentrotus purpuratus]
MGIQMKYVGVSYTHWKESAGTGVNQRTESYTTNHEYFKQEITLLGAETDRITLTAGEHRFTFQFQIPNMTLPPPFEDSYGHVRYYVKVTIDRPGKFDHHTMRIFSICSVKDLNYELNVLVPAIRQVEKTVCCLCCTSRPIFLKGMIDKRGYVSGEYIFVSLDLHNNSSRRIIDITAKLQQSAHFTAQCHDTGITHHRQSVKTVAELKLAGCEAMGSVNYDRVKMLIPPIPPCAYENCPNIQVEYYVEIKGDVSGTPKNAHVNLPVGIGTIPAFQHILKDPSQNPFAVQSIPCQHGTPTGAQPGFPQEGQHGYSQPGQPEAPPLGQEYHPPGHPGASPPRQPGYSTQGQQDYPSPGQPGEPPPGQGYPPTGQSRAPQRRQGYSLPEHPGLPPQGQHGYPPPGQPGAPQTGQPGAPPPRLQGYPPQGQQGYPPPGQPGTTPPGQPGASPPGRPGYPPQGQHGFPPPGQPGTPPTGQPGAPPPRWQGYPPQGQQGYPPPGQPGAPPPGQPGASPPGQPGFPPEGQQRYPLQGQHGYPPPEQPGAPPLGQEYPPHGQRVSSPPGQPGYPPHGQQGYLPPGQPGTPPPPQGYPQPGQPRTPYQGIRDTIHPDIQDCLYQGLGHLDTPH